MKKDALRNIILLFLVQAAGTFFTAMYHLEGQAPYVVYMHTAFFEEYGLPNFSIEMISVFLLGSFIVMNTLLNENNENNTYMSFLMYRMTRKDMIILRIRQKALRACMMFLTLAAIACIRNILSVHQTILLCTEILYAVRFISLLWTLSVIYDFGSLLYRADRTLIVIHAVIILLTVADLSFECSLITIAEGILQECMMLWIAVFIEAFIICILYRIYRRKGDIL